MQEGSSSTEITFCLQLWDTEVSPACASENKQNHSRVRGALAELMEVVPYHFSCSSPSGCHAATDSWGSAGTPLDHQLTFPLPLLCLVAAAVTQKLIHSTGLTEDAYLMWRHGGCWSTTICLPAHKTFPPVLHKLIDG